MGAWVKVYRRPRSSQKNVLRWLAPWLVIVFMLGAAARAGEDRYAAERAGMIAAIVEDVRRTASYTGRKRFDERVMHAMAAVPRHEFVPVDLQPVGYENRPLPIGYGQTISQPYIVALMTDLMGIDTDDVVLEVGTGSGYQAAVLSGLVKHVYTIEIIKPLERQAKIRLARLGYDNVTTRLGDGYYGWAEHAPFDAIIVTAAAGHVPPPLIEQLKPGGRIVIPVGGRFLTQQLLLVEKTQAGDVKTRQILPVRFVPLTGEH
jgi:protein-L-isoaspartate(D-aspartate) O-methyltransferase